jgi:hypothetical protein
MIESCFSRLSLSTTLNPDKETRGQWNPKFTMGALREKITGFVSVAMDTLKTPEMKTCIAEAFARDSDERITLVALGGLNVQGIDGVEPEVAREDIPVDNDRAFSAYRNQDDVEEGEIDSNA